MSDEDGVAGPDLTLPNPARVYDYMLGGSHNFAVDREFAGRLIEALPGVWNGAVANRAFLGRAARACLERGCRQFLDLGSGIPTAAAWHESVQRHDPTARVAYVDVEPVAVAVSREIVGDLDGVTVTAADLTDPDAVLAAPGVADLLDPAQPTAVLAVSVLHFVRDDAVLAGLLDRYCEAFGPGGMLVLSHGSTDVDDERAAEEMRTVERFTQDSAQPAVARDRATLRRLLHRADLLEPGLVDVTEWRPEPGVDPGRVVGMYAAVGDIVRWRSAARRGDRPGPRLRGVLERRAVPAGHVATVGGWPVRWASSRSGSPISSGPARSTDRCSAGRSSRVRRSTVR